MKLWLRILFGVAWGVMGTAGLAFGFIIVMLLSTFAFDSPQRRTPPELALYPEIVGVFALGVSVWALAALIIMPAQHRARRSTFLAAGLSAVLGALALMFGVGVAFLGP